MRIGKAPEEREMNPNRKSTLELSLRAYADKKDGPVLCPSIGTSFDSIDEAMSSTIFIHGNVVLELGSRKVD